jgi:arginase
MKNPSAIRIIGAASGLGAQDQACAAGPVAFQHSHVGQALVHRSGIDWGKTLYAPAADGLSPVARIAGLCRHLAVEVRSTLENHQFPVVVGGDHSVAIGTWSGVATHLGRALGLLWIDAHLDSHTPESTYSGAIHDMPLACLLGRGDKRLLSLGLAGGQVDAAHCVVLGARSYEPEEIVLLQQLGVRVITVDELESRGFPACLDEAIRRICSAPAGFGVTIDLDAIDPQLAPGVGSPEPAGLWDGDVLDALRRIAAQPGLQALEIVEYNPDRDRQGQTAALIAGLISQLLPPGHPARR